MSDNRPAKPTILAIDDDADILQILRLTLEPEGFEVHTASDPHAGLDLYRQKGASIDLVLLDYMMPGLKGDAVFASIREQNANARVVMLTAYDQQHVRNTLQQGVRGYIQKPFHLDDLIQQVRAALATP